MSDFMTTPRTTTSRLGQLGGVYALLYASHTVGDHWVQSNGQAAAKGGDGWPARRACATHVATLTATQAAYLTLGALALGERLDPRRVALALAFNAATHYWADRRFTLRRLAERCGKTGFYRLGACRDGRDDNPTLGTGAYALDQAFHVGVLAVTAVIITGRRP